MNNQVCAISDVPAAMGCIRMILRENLLKYSRNLIIYCAFTSQMNLSGSLDTSRLIVGERNPDNIFRFTERRGNFSLRKFHFNEYLFSLGNEFHSHVFYPNSLIKTWREILITSVNT